MVKIINESYHKEKVLCYTYTGPIIDRNAGVVSELEDYEIYGVGSEEEARQELSDKIQEITGRTPQSIPGRFTRTVREINVPDYCDSCGSLLDDQGVCHKCNPELDYD